MLFAAQDLLHRCPRPDDAAIRDAISGNLCRCTGYEPIVTAIAAAAEAMTDGPSQPTDDLTGHDDATA